MTGDGGQMDGVAEVPVVPVVPVAAEALAEDVDGSYQK